VLQPILVKKEGLHYELIAGERRMRACIALGKKTIPALVLDIPENKLLQFALIENIQREDLSPIEEAKAYQTMLRLENITHENLAKRIGKNRSTITNSLRLLELPREIQENVSRGTISQGHARALLSLESVDKMMDVYRKIVSQNLSVRDVEQITKDKKTVPAETKKAHKKSKDANIESYEERLKNRLGTKVDIHVKGDRGIIQIHFFNMDDFSRLYALLLEDFDPGED
jgi:ParB family chromosome partitioning protein